MPKEMPSFTPGGEKKKKDEKLDWFRTQVIEQPDNFEDNYELTPDLGTMQFEMPNFETTEEELQAAVARQEDREEKMNAARKIIAPDESLIIDFGESSPDLPIGMYDNDSNGIEFDFSSSSESFGFEEEMAQGAQLDPVRVAKIMVKGSDADREAVSERMNALPAKEKSDFLKQLNQAIRDRSYQQVQDNSDIVILQDSKGLNNIEFDFSEQPTPSDIADAKTIDVPPPVNRKALAEARRLKQEERERRQQEIQALQEQYGKELSKEELLNEINEAGRYAETPQERINLENQYVINRARAFGVPDELAKRLVTNRRIVLLSKLASQGAMGVVFESVNLVNPDLGNDIIKFAYNEQSGPAGLQRFKQEAITAANLNVSDKGVVGVRDADFSLEKEGYFMILEKAEGKDLQAELQEGVLTSQRMVTVALSLANSLKTLHDNGLVHRDIKPANVFLHNEELIDPVTKEKRTKQTVKLGDLGLTALTGEEFLNNANEVALERLDITAGGSIVGTPIFMAPEQLQGVSTNPKSDTYGLGATMFYLLTNETSVKSRSSLQELSSEILNGDNERMLDKIKNNTELEIPSDIAALIDWMMSVDPDERPTDDQLISALEAIQEGTELPEEITSRTQEANIRLSRVSDRLLQQEPQSQPEKKGFFARLFGG